MTKNILRVLILLVLLQVVVKFVSPVNDLARTYLPPPLLTLMGETPLPRLPSFQDEPEAANPPALGTPTEAEISCCLCFPYPGFRRG
jgi:hypothetical protein